MAEDVFEADSDLAEWTQKACDAARGVGIGARIRSRGARMGRRSTVDAAAELATKAQQAAVLAPRAIAGACERVPRHTNAVF